MRTSIGLRMLIGTNVLIVVLGAAVAYLAGSVAGEVVEERLVRQVAEDAGGFLADRHLPFSDTLMHYLRRLFGVDFVTLRGEGGEVLASSLPPDQTARFAAAVRSGGLAGRVELGGAACRYDSHVVTVSSPETAAPRHVRLFVVVPDTVYRDARRRAFRRIVILTVPAVAVASLLAVGLSVTISRPLRRLAERMDRTVATHGAERGAMPEAPQRGPSEVQRLGESFRQLLERLADAQAKLTRAERLATLGRVAAGVAHEMRNPLSGIKMNMRILQDELAGSEAGRATVELVSREVDRMDLFLRELMGLAAGGGGEEAPALGADLAPVALGELADGVVALLGGRLRHAGAEVVRDYAPDCPHVPADANRIRQVMTNLVVNAMEAMPGGGRVTLRLARAGEGWVRFSVSDTGGGVRAGEMDIFDAFTTTKPGGVGLGLYLCRKSVFAHGGRIGYQNNAERGATFWFELPTAR